MPLIYRADRRTILLRQWRILSHDLPTKVMSSFKYVSNYQITELL